MNYIEMAIKAFWGGVIVSVAVYCILDALFA